ncbi:MAG: MMPL family transporter [Pseudomonadales bacterium]|nr:MMPL family transporter [Pseudomonadales bacterium]
MSTQTIARWIMNHPKTHIAWVVLFALLLGAGGHDPQFSANQRDSFQSSDANLQRLIAIEQEFSSEKNIFILIEPNTNNVFDQRSLQVIREVTDLGWQVPYSQRVESVTNHLYTTVDEDELNVGYLFEALGSEEALSEEEIIQRSNYALNKDGVRDFLVTAKGHMALVSITVSLPEEASAEAAKDAVDFTRENIQKVEAKYPDVNFRVLGSVVMEVSMPEIVQSDTETVIPIAFLIVVIFMIFMLRDPVVIVAALVTCILAIISGMGAVLWADVKLSPVLMNTPAVIIILAMADCIHLVVNYFQGLIAGKTKKEALEKSIEVNFLPIVFTSITTALSFLALNFSASPPFAHMGNAAAVGILFAMLASLFFLPAVLYYLPAKVSGIQQLPNLSRLLPLYQVHGTKIVVGFVMVVIVCTAMIPFNRLDDNFVEWFDESMQFRQDFDVLTKELGGSVVINISVPAKSENGVTDPEYLQLLAELDDFIKSQHQHMYSVSLVEVMKTLNQRMHDNESHWYRVPKDQSLASQYLLLYEMSLPFGLGLDNLINHQRSKSRVIAVFGSLSDKEVIELESQLNSWFNKRLPSGQQAVVASSNIAFAHLQYANVNRLSKGFIVALVGISLLLIFMFRSLSMGMISIIPNLLPALLAFGFWALINGKVGFGVSIGITLTLGIVVDDTIHFLSKYQYARRVLHLSNTDAVNYAMETVAAAMFLTTMMVMIALGAMLMSNFTPNQDIALITIITVFFAALIDLVLLPTILLKWAGTKLVPEQTKKDLHYAESH